MNLKCKIGLHNWVKKNLAQWPELGSKGFFVEEYFIRKCSICGKKEIVNESYPSTDDFGLNSGSIKKELTEEQFKQLSRLPLVFSCNHSEYDKQVKMLDQYLK